MPGVLSPLNCGRGPGTIPAQQNPVVPVELTALSVITQRWLVDGLKQRIIGALVLICLAIIFVPMLFDEPHEKQETRVLEIPNEPENPQVSIEQPQKPELSNDQAMPAEPQQVPAQNRAEDRQQTVESAPVKPAPVLPSNSAAPATATTTPKPQPEPVPRQPEPAPTQPEPKPVPQPASPPTSTATSAKPGAGSNAEYSQTLKGAWVVQLGSFGDTDNAQRMLKAVRGKGYAAFLQQAESGGKTLTRVFSGPFVEKSEAEAAKTRLDQTFHINSLVMAGDG